MKFTIFLPSRGRPKLCGESIEAIRRTQAWDNEILLGLDTDDEQYPDFGVKVMRFELLGMAEKVHKMQQEATGDYFIVVSDDLFCVTPGWDELLASKFPEDGIAGIYHKDSIGEHKGSTNIVVTRRWHEAIGFFPPYFRHFYADTWCADIANRLGRQIYAPDVILEHRHPKFGLGQWDKTYTLRGGANRKEWERLEPERASHVETLRKLIGTPWKTR